MFIPQNSDDEDFYFVDEEGEFYYEEEEEDGVLIAFEVEKYLTNTPIQRTPSPPNFEPTIQNEPKITEPISSALLDIVKDQPAVKIQTEIVQPKQDHVPQEAPYIQVDVNTESPYVQHRGGNEYTRVIEAPKVYAGPQIAKPYIAPIVAAKSYTEVAPSRQSYTVTVSAPEPLMKPCKPYCVAY
eukprot:TRINITY_DN597_c0_g1_i2.p1 TRINITY_DN597_c0_g1~~TRINITY_DN597_c0_g1_i2.p1  ORF type:complete len:184 (+),score=52.85 TRINITY_DN597_c0_g1_i2:120-671(+)